MRTSFNVGSIGLVAMALLGLACGSEAAPIAGVPGGPGGTSDTDPTDPPAPTDPNDPEAPQAPLATEIAITDVAFFQAVKVPVVAKGAWVKTRNAPVVANRPAMVRVYVAPTSAWTAQEVTAELRLVSGETKLPLVRETKKITAASTDEDTKSTFNLEVPAESLPPGVTFQVALTTPAGVKPEGESDARFPTNGEPRALDVDTSGKLKIVIVPVQYEADGSGRVPDTGPAQLELFKKTFMARYPATEVEITTRAPYAWSTTISRNGSGFSSILNAITRLRQADRVSADTYYYGLLAPAPSMSQFCGGGCVTGLSSVVDDRTSFLRASVGIGFPGQDSVNTAAHEIGHAHGREHAPCGGADGVDPEFPYSGGAIGVWGYNMFDKTLISPTRGRDMMGYCPNEWVSDYTYSALFDRIALANGQKSIAGGGGTGGGSHTFRIATEGVDGDIAWDGDLDLDEEPAGGIVRDVSYLTASGTEIASRKAHFYPYDHLPGGVTLVPKELAAAWSTVRIRGVGKTLAR